MADSDLQISWRGGRGGGGGAFYPYGEVSWPQLEKSFMIRKKIVHLRQLEGVSFVNRRYTKGVPFLSKKIRGGGAGRLEDPLRITLC